MRILIVGSSAEPGADDLVVVVHDGKLGCVSLHAKPGIKCWKVRMEQPAGKKKLKCGAL